MYKFYKKLQLLPLLVLIAFLASCENSNDSNITTSSESTTITGTAATGLAIDGLVTATSSAGNVSEQVGIDSNGQFSVEIEGEPPYLLMAQSTDGNTTLYSIGFEAGITNITPFSHQVLTDLYAGKQLSEIFNNWSVESALIDEPTLTKSVSSLVNATSNVFVNANVDMNSFDVVRSHFITDHTGFDAVLDAIASTLPTGTVGIDGSVSYSNDLIFIDPDDPTEIPDDADTPPITTPDEQIFIDPNDDTEIDEDADIGVIPTLNSSEELIYIDPNDDTEIDLDSDMGTLELN